MVPVMSGDDWRSLAACRKEPDPEVFFPENGGNYTRARKICATCPVTEPCLALALRSEAGTSDRLRAGMFGGLTPEERCELERDLRRKRREGVA